MKNQEQANLDYSDLEQDAEESLETSMAQLDMETQPQDMGLSIREKGTNEVLYIIFTCYRKDVDEIVKSYNCHIRVSISTYMISNKDSNQTEQFGKCCKEIAKFINSINYEKITQIVSISKKPHLSESVRYNHSPYFTELLKNKDIGLMLFHDDVYAFSRMLKAHEIKDQIINITRNKLIFPVRFNKENIKKMINKEEFEEINVYLNKVFLHYYDFFKERDIIVEINATKNFVYLIGERQKYLMEAKLTIKNVIQSLVCIIIKNTTIHQKTLVAFLEKASIYPIHFAKLSQKRCILISKDNILKQLINKSASFFKYIGIKISSDESPQKILQSKIGLFLIRSPTYKIKIEKARQVCTEKGYDLYSTNGIFYISQVFHQEGKQSNDFIRNILGNMMSSIEASKQKFETINRLKAQEKHQDHKESLNPLKYTLKGGRTQEKELSTLMKRDVLTERVQMKKEFMIAFNVIETKEEVKYWLLNPTGEEGEQITKEQLKPGKFLRGLRRIDEDGTIATIFQEILTVI